MLWRAPIERTPTGFRFHLGTDERALLERLATELEALLAAGEPKGGDPVLRRLYPDAYDDDAAAAEYRELVAGELREERRAAAAALRRTLGKAELTEDEIDAWARAVNDLRLVLGTRLGVTEELYDQELDDDDPRAPELAVFFYLTWLQERIIQALAAPPRDAS